MPRPRTITSSPTPAHGRAGRRRSPRLRLRPPNDGDRNCATCSRAVAELAHAVVAPAVDRSGGREPAGVTIARSDGHEAQAPGDSDRNKAVGGGADAELAVLVVSPTVGRPAGREAATVSAADGESGEAEVPCCSPRRVRR